MEINGDELYLTSPCLTDIVPFKKHCATGCPVFSVAKQGPGYQIVGNVVVVVGTRVYRQIFLLVRFESVLNEQQSWESNVGSCEF